MNESPPVLIGENVLWLGSGSGIPKKGKVKWLGKLAEMGPGWAVGVELEEELPYGGIDGTWGPRKLFDCEQKHGLIVPASSVVPERRYLHSVKEEGQRTPKGSQRRQEKEPKGLGDEKKKNGVSVTGQRENALVPIGSRLERANERTAGRSSSSAIPRKYLSQPRTKNDRRVEEGVICSWMVDHQRHNERVVFKRMDIRRQELNRSLDDGLAFDSPRSSFHSSRSSGGRNRSSGIFALFKWFKKEKGGEESDLEVCSDPASPVLPRNTSIAGSVDTLFSTATAHSFAYVPPLQYRPFGSANPPEIRIALGPETNTYRNRIRERERQRRLENNISLREKYRLYASGTLPRSVDHIHELRDEQEYDLRKSLESPLGSRNSTLRRLKRRAPPPPQVTPEKPVDIKPEELGAAKGESSGVKQHRRTLSEPSRYTKASHVKGKRKAPPPPASNCDPDVVSICTTNSNSSKRSRKKRRAPSPPIKKDDHYKNTGIVNIIREATNGILDEELGILKKDDFKEETASTASTVDVGSADVVCTDTLKLERGILKPNMEKGYMDTKVSPSSPVSPRPWYKRAANKDLGSMKDKDKRKERDRKKVEDWMLESGFPRRSLLNYDNKCNIFSRTDKSDDKRKSQISILTNISELDREAAEIIRRGKERERNLIESHNAMFYNNNNNTSDVNETPVEPVENPRKNSAKDLISLFNAITNVTKVTVNTSFLSKDSSILFNKDNKEKPTKPSSDKYIKGDYNRAGPSQAIEIESFDEVVHRRVNEKATVIDDKPGSSGSSTNGKIAKVTIEELDEYDAERSSKAQALYEAQKQNRHLAPPIPTITEVSEGSAKSSPTSTIASNTSDLPADPPQDAAVTSVKPMNVWICPRCTLENLRWRLTCEACEMWRPNPYEVRERAAKAFKSSNSSQESKNASSNGTANSDSMYPNLSNLNINALQSSSKSSSVRTDTDKKENLKETEKNITNCYTTEKIVKTSNETSHKEVEKRISSDKQGNSMNGMKSELKDVRKPIDKAIVLDKVLSALEGKGNGKKSEIKTEAHVVVENNDLLQKNISQMEFRKTNGTSQNDTKKPIAPNETEKVTEEVQQTVNEEEVRRARLAFFNKNNSGENDVMEIQKVQENKILESPIKSNDKLNKSETVEENRNILQDKRNESGASGNNLNQNKISKSEIQASAENRRHSTTKITVDDDKQKLKEMLIEMKHSLPKRPKPFKKVNDECSTSSGISDSNKISVSVADQPKSGNNHIKPTTSRITTAKPIFSDEKAEAYLVESETIIEEVKIKKPSEKVSSSVQTSGLVTQISPKVRPHSGKEIFIPIKVEEHKIKDGILYTSVSNQRRRLGSGTFELLRPRDFACIKDIKTDASPGPLPVYANVADDGTNSSVKPEEEYANSSAFIDKLSEQLVRPQGVANFRARFDLGNDSNMNTLAVNRLLKRLESAIAGGNHELAAALARELAQMKVNCSVIRQKTEIPTNELLLNLYVEDKVSHQGPFPLKVKSNITVGGLKEAVERDYEIPIGVQRWILGKQLANDDSSSLESLGVTEDGSAVFLYLVAPDLNPTKNEDVLEVEIKPSTSGVTHKIEVEEQLEEPEVITHVAIAKEPNGKLIIKEEEPVPGPSDNKLKNNIEIPVVVEIKREPTPTGTLKLGWKCEVCTLMNSPTRPGCVACSANRPQAYEVPEEYKPNQVERERIKKENQNDEKSAKAVEEEKEKNYRQLVDLERDDLIICMEAFECPICLAQFLPTEGVVLRECLHAFCRPCLADTIHFSDDAEVKCPFRDNKYTCDSTLLEREIKALVTPQAYEEHLAKSIALAETKIDNTFHCKTPDCKGWCIFEDNVNIFKCPVCTHTNCLTCQAIHEGLNCKQYQEQLNNPDMNVESKRTKEMLQEMVDRGEAMNCPTCQVVLMKKWGCDWLRCSMCKTEICWITRGPRWGPNGKGDTSGGCQCGVNGIKCHPKCTYCH